MTQTQPRTISFLPDDVLFQYFTKKHLDVCNKLTEEQWEEFLSENQPRFAYEVTAIANEMMENCIEEQVLSD